MTTNVILIKSLKTDREISNRCQINNVLWSFLRFDFYFIATIKEEIGLKKKPLLGTIHKYIQSLYRRRTQKSLSIFYYINDKFLMDVLSFHGSRGGIIE